MKLPWLVNDAVSRLDDVTSTGNWINVFELGSRPLRVGLDDGWDDGCDDGCDGCVDGCDDGCDDGEYSIDSYIPPPYWHANSAVPSLFDAIDHQLAEGADVCVHVLPPKSNDDDDDDYSNTTNNDTFQNQFIKMMSIYGSVINY